MAKGPESAPARRKVRSVWTSLNRATISTFRRMTTSRSSSATRSGRERLTLAPVNGPLYAVGDVHGCVDELRLLEALILEDARSSGAPATVIMLGDYVDRGPRSADVLAHLMAPRPGLRRHCLCGNHEAMMLDFLSAPSTRHPWLSNGGIETLASYGLNIRHLMKTYPDRRRLRRVLDEALPAEHVAFLKALPIAILHARYLFVHAGVRPGIPIEAQEDYDLLWIRQPFLAEGPRIDRIVVHGHTPSRTVERGNGRIGVDTGAFATGCLSAVRLDEDVPSALSTQRPA